ncbi:short-chain dehydrogenase [Melioribacter sp. OK-6-Me]|uniref:short-chain dehydrogenase n=1 Tax=unclassified Melioribacter TaxID=2627329 RepID=UPI003EDA172A
MDIQNKTVLVLGAWGLVGNAVTRKLVSEKPKRIIVTSLKKEEALAQVEKLKKEFTGLPEDYFVPWWGNIFVRYEFKDKNRLELLEDPESRRILMYDIMEELNDEILEASAAYKLIMEFKPEIVIDCVNSATAIAYQDIYSTYYRIKRLMNEGSDAEVMRNEMEKLFCSEYVPQIIRHVQILYNAMSRAGTKIYFKIGTSGTGGMGLNIPYTHSEEKPSRVLLSKSAVAGAHTLLLFLMGRTPQGPITKEIKPTAAIAWKKIEFGEIRKGGKPIEIQNVDLNDAVRLEGKLQLKPDIKFKSTGESLKSVYIDTGENGTFSRGEFEAITTQGQMEYVTPEEIADDLIYEIKGGNTGHDIINALDNATLEPTYRAGFLQHSAVEKLEELENLYGKESVAFELLGPPRLSKLLHEINLLRHVAGEMKRIPEFSPAELSNKVFEYIKENDRLRNEIISIGIPILLPDGKSLLRGNTMKIPPFRGENELNITAESIDLWAHDGWVDLREKNMETWIERINAIIAEASSIPEEDTSSMHVRTRKYWNDFGKIDIGKVVGWIFSKEEKGERMKA